jgi:DNA-binding Lrp family transcriptional regulator
MSRHILPIISHLPQLRSSLRTTAQCLAYYADDTGRVTKAFSAIAACLHVSLSTAKRHIPKLVEKGIIEKHTRRLAHNRCATNVYRFTSWVMALLPKRADGGSMHQKDTKREKIFVHAPAKMPRPPLSEAEREWNRRYEATNGLGGVP